MKNTKPREQTRFEAALRQVLTVSKQDLAGMLEEERRQNAGKPKRGPRPKSSVSDRASGGSD
jgi:hypothetical protein